MSFSEIQEIRRVPQPPVCWRSFLRAFAMQLDTVAGVSARDTLLRSVGRQMASLRPVPAVLSMDALEAEMNDVLSELGWGQARLLLQETERFVVIIHVGLPGIGSAGKPMRPWLVAALEGLYEGWFLQQQDADPSLAVRQHGMEDLERVVLRYGRNISAAS